MSEALILAKQYFELSNKGRLEDIKNLFTPSSTYRSASMGLYLGADQIMEMQADFFASYESLSWTVNSVEEPKPGIVLFDFTFHGKSHNGKSVSRRGLEHVVVYNGKIQHIEVRNQG